MINTNKLQLLSGQFIFPAVDKHQGGFSVTRPARPLVDSSGRPLGLVGYSWYRDFTPTYMTWDMQKLVILIVILISHLHDVNSDYSQSPYWEFQ